MEIHDTPPLFGLASGGVCRAISITRNAVRSYRTLSPLPLKNGGLLSAALSIGSHRLAVNQRLTSMMPGLSSSLKAAIRPTGERHYAKL